MRKDLQIIEVKPEDNQKLMTIGYRTFYDSFGPPINSEENIQSYLQKKFNIEQITIELNHPESMFYFAIIGNQIVGYLKLNINSAQTESVIGNGLEIERIYVVKEQQGKKIGQYLFDKCIEVAKLQKKDFIWLGVWDQNLNAIKFYERNGFKTFDKHQFMLGTDQQTDLMMKLQLVSN